MYKSKKVLFLFLGPTLILILGLLYYPFVSNIINSTYDMKRFTDKNADFIGLQNYIYLFKDPNMKVVMINTFKLMIYTVVFQVGIGLVLALLVSNIKKGATFFRVVYFFPIVISATAIGLMFILFYQYHHGMLNQILEFFGSEKVVWLSKDNNRAFKMLTLPVVWQYIGFYFVLFITGISTIPRGLYEAAEIDGATGLQKVIYVTLPLLKGTINVCIILALTGALKVFDMFWIIAPKGAPGGSTHILGTYLYDMAFEAGNVDYGATIAVLLVIMGITISQCANYFFREKN